MFEFFQFSMDMIKRFFDWVKGKPQTELDVLKAIKKRLGWIVFFLIIIAIGIGELIPY